MIQKQEIIMIQYENLTIRQAEVDDAKQLAAWWNDGAVMAHDGFPHGLGTPEDKVARCEPISTLGTTNSDGFNRRWTTSWLKRILLVI